MTTATTTLQVTFESASASYQNTFGWYNSATGMGGILFADATTLTSGATATFTVNTSDLANIQYFLVSNGAADNSDDQDDLTGAVKVIQLSDGTWAVADVDSHGNVITQHGQPDILNGTGANALFTQTSKNAGGVDYASSLAGSNQTAATLAGDTADGATGTLAWEDIAATKNKNGTYSKPGDADYNDAVFNVSIYHAPPVAKNDSNTVSEDAGATTLNVLANDSDPNAGATFGVTSVHTSGLLGTVTIAAGGQSISYNPGTAFQYLAVGEKATETFTYTITDSFGGTSTATETVTITGVNDAPTVASANAAATVTEIADNASGENTATHSANGSISFNDQDLSDSHTVSATAVGSSYLGTFTATLPGDANSDDDDNSPGTVTWNYSVKDSALDYLAAGQTLTQKYNVAISDGHGGTTTQVVTITLVGTNDAPTISSAVTTGAVTELPDGSAGENVTTLTSSGTISFNDVDLADVHTTSVTAGGSGYVGALTAAVSNDSTGDGAGTVSWTFSVSDGAIDFLSAGQKLTQTYTVAINDGHGGTVSKNIVITITGAADATNHAPIAVADIASVTEDVTLTATGNVLTNDTDADSTDTHSVTAVNGSATNVGALLTGTYGTLTLNSNGIYTYALTNGQTNVQALAQGQIVSDVFAYTNSDNHGGSSSSTLTISITGTNDVPVIGGAHAGSVTEDVSVASGNIATSGVLTIADADAGQSSFVAQTGTAGSHGYGTFTLTANGNWTYSANDGQSAIQQLGAGQTITDNFTAVSSDGTASQVVTVTISGTNDVAVIGGATTGSVTEDISVVGGNIATGGTLTVNDADAGQSGFTAQGSTAGSHGYGTFTLAANGAWTYSANDGQTAIQQLGTGQTLTDSFTAVSSDGSASQIVTVTISGTDDAPVAVADTNAGDPVVESGVVVSGNTPFAGDASAAGNALTNDTDVDNGDTHSVTAVNGNGANVGVAVNGTYGTLKLNANGSYTYTLNNALAATNALAQGEVQSDVFTYTNSDNHGGSSTTTLSIAVTGTNDMPVITGGTTTGHVTEDTATTTATGTITVVDPDHNAQQFWTVVGGTPSGTANYHFRMDTLTITKGGNPFFQDDFSDGNPPPSAPATTVANGYGGVGGFTESGGELHLDSNNAAPFVGVGTPDPIIGEDALLRTNIDPSTPTNGLRLGTTFNVTGVFDLILPDSAREEYGIRLMDRLIGGTGTPADQDGDDTISLTVRENISGNLVVALRDIDFQHNVTTNIASVPLIVPAGADQIALHLNHVANTQVLTASFDYLQAGNVIGTQTFGATTAPIFNNEDWTRADIVADAPAITDSTLGGTYGTLDIGQSGAWTYTLNNSAAATQALAQGQTATDTFNVQVADQYGATSATTVTVNVTGTNDLPVMQTGPVLRSFTEDLSADANNHLTATGLAQFSDVDLTDTHTVYATLTSSSIGVNTSVAQPPPAIPAGLAALLPGAMTATLTDPATGDGHGQLQWNFALDNNAVQFLAFGQVVTLNYLINVTDNHGATAAENVTIVINGNNDVPTPVAAGTIAGGSVAESTYDVPEITHVVTGTVAFTDADLTDVHTAGGDFPAGTQVLGHLSATIAPGNDSTGGGTGIVNWTYTIPDSSIDYLAQGETYTDNYFVGIDDGHGGIAQQAVPITLTGSNDLPVMQTPDQNLSFTEDSAPQFTASGTSDFSDIDRTDTHTVTSTLASATLSSGASLPAGLSAQLANDFSTTFLNDDSQFTFGAFSWNFSLNDSAVQFLAQGEVLNLSYRADVQDPFGAIGSQYINIAVTGTNDAPIITTPEGSTTITGPSSALIFSDNFDQEAGGHGGQLIESYTSFQNWNVTRGNVDFYDEPNSFENVFPGNGGYVDLAGSTYGTLTSKTTYGPGTYELTFSIGGTGRTPIYHNNPDGVNVSFGSYSENFIPGDSQIITVTRDVTLTSSAQLSFADLGLSGNGNIGATLFDVAITQEDVTGSVTAVTSATSLTTSGSFAFTDVDLIDTHSTTVTAQNGDIGTLTAHVSTDTTGTGTGGIVTWDYQVDEAAAAALTTAVVDTFTVTLSDNPGATAQEVIRVAVLPPSHVNQAPVANADVDSVVESGVNPGNTPFAGTPSAAGNVLNNDSDVDGGTHSVTAVNGSAASVGAVVNGTYGTLTIDSSGTYTYTLDNSRAATDELAQGVVQADVFTYTNTDNGGASSSSTLTISVTGTNDAPVTNADSNAGDPVIAGGLNPGNTAFGGDAFAAGNVLANDTDVDSGDSHTVSAINGSAGNVGVALNGTYGTLTLNSDGGWNYVLDFTRAATVALAQDQVANEVFSYTDTDNNGASSSSTLTISVTGTNDGPVAVANTNAGDPVIEAGVNPGNTAFAGDPTATGNVLANDTDADIGDTHTVSAVGGDPTKVGVAVSGIYGSVTINADGSYTYTLNNSSPATDQLAQGATGTDIFVYTDSDSHGATNSTSLSITVTGTNDAPVASAISSNVDKDGSPVTLTAAYTDPDSGDTHSYSINTTGTHGTVTNNDDGTFSYDPNGQFEYLATGTTATDTFQYTVNDGHGGTSTATATVTITGVNAAATISGTATGTVVEAGGINNGTPGTPTASGTLTVHDADNGQSVFQTPASLAGTYGAFTFNSTTGAWGYTLNNAAANVQALSNTAVVHDTLTVKSLDGTATQTIDVTIQGSNDAPTVTGQSTGSVTEDAPSALQARGNLLLSDPDGGSPAWSIVGGATTAQTQDFRFQVDNLKIVKNGTTFFEDTFGDGVPPPSGPNLSPTTGINSTAYTTNGAFTEAAGRAFFDGTQSVVFGTSNYGERALLNTDTSPVSDPNNGSKGLKRNSDFVTEARFDLITPQDGGDAYGVRLTDTSSPSPNNDSTADLVVLRDATGVHVVLREINIATGTNTTLQSIDLTPPTASQIVLRLSYDHTSYVDATAGGSVTAAFDIVTNGAVVSTTTFASQATIFKGEDFTQVQLVGQSTQTETGVYKLVGTYGTLTVAQDGEWHYFLADQQANVQALAQGQQVTDNFTIRVSDGAGGVTDKPVSITVNGVNDAAVIGDPTVTDVTEDTNVNGGNLTATGTISITDVDTGQAAFQTGVTPAVGDLGTLTLAANGSYTYSVANSAVQSLGANSTKIETFTVTSIDGTTKQVNFTIHGVNDSPVAQPDSGQVVEAGTLVNSDQVTVGNAAAGGNVLLNDHDPDIGDVPSVSGVSAGVVNTPLSGNINLAVAGTYGALTISPTGAWSYNLDNSDPDTNALAQGQVVSDVFTYTVIDGHGGTSNQTVTVNVTGTDDAPTVSSPLKLEVLEGSDNHQLDLLANAGDAEGNSFHVANVHWLEVPNSLPPGITVNADGHTISINTNDPAFTGLATGETLDVNVAYDLVDSLGAVSHQEGTVRVVGTDVVGGEEFRVNTYTNNSQYEPSVAALTGGGFVISWWSFGQDGDQGGIYAQRYNADGTPTGGEFQVNTVTQNYQESPSVVGLASGGFVISWLSQNEDSHVAVNGSARGVYERVYDANGVATSGEILVNTFVNGPQELPSLAALADGTFVNTWSSYGQDGSVGGEPWSVYGQHYAADGSRIGGEFHVNTYTPDDQSLVSTTGLAGGGFVSTWASNGEDGSGWGVYGQLYGASANRIAGEFLVNSTTAGDQIYPTVASLTNGGFVVTWTGQDGDGDGIFGQRYDSAGAAVNGEFQINTYTAGDQRSQSVTGLADGGFMVMWTSPGEDGDGLGVYGRRYDAAGDASGGEFRINETTAGDQRVDGETGKPALDQLTNGDVVAGWYGPTPGSDIDAYARILSLDANHETVTVHNGFTFDLNVPHQGAAQFEGPTGTLQIDQSQTFAGTVSGFSGQETIDLRDIAFSPNTTLGYAANAGNTGGTLTVGDGAGHSANIALLGQYTAASFAASSDGHGGTTIIDPPVQDPNQITQPHA